MSGQVVGGYDANGSLLYSSRYDRQTGQTDLTRYAYDPRNRLVGLDKNGDGNFNGTGDASFAYDPEGNRVGRKVVGGQETLFLVDTNNPTGYSQTLEERPSLGSAPSMSYVLGLDVVAQAAAGAAPLLYIGYDGQGSTRFLTAPAGEAVEGSRYGYDAFGNALNFDPAAAATGLLYAGERSEFEGLD